MYGNFHTIEIPNSIIICTRYLYLFIIISNVVSMNNIYVNNINNIIMAKHSHGSHNNSEL